MQSARRARGEVDDLQSPMRWELLFGISSVLAPFVAMPFVTIANIAPSSKARSPVRSVLVWH